MARMVVMYRKPANPAEFQKHYFEVHVPLAKQLDGLRKYEVSMGSIATISGSFEPFLVATLTFDSLEAIKAAFATDLGRRCATDRRILAPNDNDVQMFLINDQEV